jgi:hypothetical protein
MNNPSPSPHMPQRADKRRDEPAIDGEQRALIERARQLGATAEELEAELAALARQAEAVLHRLRGGNLH